jgi:hypothetical protein
MSIVPVRNFGMLFRNSSTCSGLGPNTLCTMGKRIAFGGIGGRGRPPLCTLCTMGNAIAEEQDASVEAARREGDWHIPFRHQLGVGERFDWANLSREVSIPRSPNSRTLWFGRLILRGRSRSAHFTLSSVRAPLANT